ncbi:MAG: hypothetical protein SGPRY_000370 [Prymnesium sp.]
MVSAVMMRLWPLALLAVVRGACSPAENKCGDLCCCVTCKCLEGPFSCEDMWGKPTDPVGYSHDKRWVDPAWIENHHREQMEIAEQHRREHMERMREMEANLSPEEKARREKRMEKHRRRMERRMKDRELRKDRSTEDDEDDLDDDLFLESDGMSELDMKNMRRRMAKRTHDSIGKHRRHQQEGEPSKEGYTKGWGSPEDAQREL